MRCGLKVPNWREDNSGINQSSENCLLYLLNDNIHIARVKILAVLAGITQPIARYMEENNLKLPPMQYSLYAGQITSRRFKEKLLNFSKGRAFVCMSRICILFFTFFLDRCMCIVWNVSGPHKHKCYKPPGLSVGSDCETTRDINIQPGRLHSKWKVIPEY